MRFLQQYDDYDPTDIPADQAAPAQPGYLPAARRGRKLTNRRGEAVSGKMKKHNMNTNYTHTYLFKCFCN